MSDIHSFEPIWPNWVIDEVIGRGSFGTVWKAHRVERYAAITQNAAVKHISLPNETAAQEMAGVSLSTARKYYRGQLDQLVKEIEAMINLKGAPHIVAYEEHKIVEKPEGTGFDLFLRMELLTSLPSYIQQGNPFQKEDVIKLGIHMAQALEILQSKNFIHRDIKPQNVFVDGYGNYKLGDFGTARALQGAGYASTRAGSPNYMAPEVYNSIASYDQTVDIYSLGIMLYRYMNNGFLPFTNDREMDAEAALLKRIKGTPMPPPSGADAELSHVILKACAYAPADRYQNARELRQALNNLQNRSVANCSVPVVCILSGSNLVLESTVEIFEAGSKKNIYAPVLKGYEVIGNNTIVVSADESGCGNPDKVTFVYQIEQTIANPPQPPVKAAREPADFVKVPVICETIKGENLSRKLVACQIGQATMIPAPQQTGYTLVSEESISVHVSRDGKAEPKQALFLWEKKKSVKKGLVPIAAAILLLSAFAVMKLTSAPPVLPPTAKVTAKAPVTAATTIAATVAPTVSNAPPTTAAHTATVAPSATSTPAADLSKLDYRFGFMKLSIKTNAYSLFSHDVYLSDLREGEGFYLSTEITNTSEQDMTIDLSYSVNGGSVEFFSPPTIAAGSSRVFYVSSSLKAGNQQATWYVNGESVGQFAGKVLAGSSEVQTNTPAVAATSLPTQTPAAKQRKEPVVTSAREEQGVNFIDFNIYDDGVEQYASIKHYHNETDNSIIPVLLGGLPVVGIEEGAYRNSSLKGTLRLPDSLRWIKGNPFAPSLSFSADGNHPNFAVENGLLIEKATNRAIALSANAKGVEKYAIPQGVQSIEAMAFSEAWMRCIDFPDSVKSIGDGAFYGCDNLSSITIPNGVTSIGDEVFQDCRALTSVEIPASLRHIGSFPFDFIISEPTITISPENTFFEVQNGLLIDKQAVRVVQIVDRRIKKCTIPTGMKSIGSSAFQYSNIESVMIPGSVQEIGVAAFKDCNRLQTIKIPEGVTRIEKDVLSWCEALKSVQLPKSAKSIGNHAFAVCPSLSSINIPVSVTVIGDSAFAGCKSLPSIQIPEGVKTIGERTFEGCEKLKAIKLPESIVEIKNFAFRRCSALKTVEIPQKVAKIGQSSFSDCAALTTMKIYNNKMIFDLWAFENCPKLTLRAAPDSSAERYAKSNNIPFKKL